MGCNYSTATLDASPQKNMQDRRPRAYLLPEYKLLGINEESTQYSKTFETPVLKDFNLIYTDFIGEKSGKITDFYTFLDPRIGKGAYGEVKKAIHKKTNILRAVKIISKTKTDEAAQEKLINEVEVLKKLDHPNIMKIFEFYQDEHFFYIVSEYYTGGDLFQKIEAMKFFGEVWAAKTMKQILSAISYCHANSIVHRDLKPENIIFESNDPEASLKVIDFGTSRIYDAATQMHSRYGTPYYIAPEVLKGNYNEKCDVWSCGVMLYILLCGKPPFNGDDEKEILEAVAKGEFYFNTPGWRSVSKQAKLLIQRMLQSDPSRRCSAEEAINDPWFKMKLEERSIDKPIAVSALTNLRHFRAERKLHYATWMFLVSYFASQEEKNDLLHIFQALDLNGDGQLSKEELIKGYQTMMDDAPDIQEEMDSIMEMVDLNHSGAIDYTEFVIASINRRNLLKKEKIEAAFKIFDKDGDGFVTPHEFEEVFNPGRQKDVSQEVWEELIKEFDTNGDGKISMKEFKDMMSRLVDEKKK